MVDFLLLGMLGGERGREMLTFQLCSGIPSFLLSRFFYVIVTKRRSLLTRCTPVSGLALLSSQFRLVEGRSPGALCLGSCCLGRYSSLFRSQKHFSEIFLSPVKPLIQSRMDLGQRMQKERKMKEGAVLSLVFWGTDPKAARWLGVGEENPLVWCH